MVALALPSAKAEVESDQRIVRVSKLSPFWYPAIRLLVPLHPYVTVDVAGQRSGSVAFRVCSRRNGAGASPS
jgi:hypothetical protein